ncbi:MAG: permease prefix domain 1-containing protein, partial [Limisphaerales bacterium]
MATVSQFDLNSALQLWLERLGQSSQVKAENLKELESHIRDSVSQMQSKGLSSEESFLVATHRVGSVEKLEPEFAKVNRSPRNMIVHGVILAFFSVSCFFLWGLMQVPRMLIGNGTNERLTHLVPRFTQLL